jgi:hypothetical protein
MEDYDHDSMVTLIKAAKDLSMTVITQVCVCVCVCDAALLVLTSAPSNADVCVAIGIDVDVMLILALSQHLPSRGCSLSALHSLRRPRAPRPHPPFD